MTIHLGRVSPRTSRDLPGWLIRKQDLSPLQGSRHPYLILLQAGFSMPLPLPVARCALTAPFHPCPRKSRAVCFLWHFPWGRPRRVLPGTLFPRSPDFPPAAAFAKSAGGHPANWQK